MIFGAATDLPPTTCSASYVKDVEIQTRDSQVLACTTFHPTNKSLSSPTVLIRNPYNRCHLDALGYRFAERGFHVVIQDVRGRCASGGVDDLLGTDAADAADTVEWIRAQIWFAQSPKIVMWAHCISELCSTPPYLMLIVSCP